METELAVLPDEFKRELVLGLFDEFGITRYNETGKGELQHACTLPFGGHTDRSNTTSGSVNYKKLVYSCFVCGHKGGLIWWIAANRGVESREDVENWLSSRTGIEGRSRTLDTQLKILEGLRSVHKSTPEQIPVYDDRILTKWQWEIQHPWLTDIRHLPAANLDRYEVGYDLDDLYIDRIIIPLRWKGDLVGWQARKVPHSADPNPAKYLNSPDTPRDRILYGDVNAKEIVLVESPMSVLRHAHHLPMVATMGTKVTSAQLGLLHKYRRIVLCYDNDQAGMQAIEYLVQNLRRYTEVLVGKNPYIDTDPAQIADKTFQRIVTEAVPWPLWKPPMLADLIEYKE